MISEAGREGGLAAAAGAGGAAGLAAVPGVARAGVAAEPMGMVLTPCITFFSCRSPLGQGMFCRVSAPLASVQR
ncbi:hypothetical protein DT603_13195 [Pseudoxanthomonas gei]|uniref:Uncharacterized protein n=1 Tax=Pseudoxanthomonas gei TaxID=1383030 RepID=A0ABX0ADX7_9GAMM|nr:hypothetical protein [Pseudoxanthomonas gei]